MDPARSSEIIRRLASETGFMACGFAAAGPLAGEQDHYSRWLERKVWGRMDYLRREAGKRLDPRLVMGEAKSVIALLAGYHSGVEIPPEENYMIARYARGRDYHQRVREMADALTDGMKREFGAVRCRSFVDSGVLMEKAWAEACGIGWRGKNTLLVNPRSGSWVFIGIILTDLEIEPDNPETDHCGTCDRCVRACPTGALEGPHVLNPLKCISYHTIETESEIPESFRGLFGTRIFGCDICQEVCPFNRTPQVCPDPDIIPSPELVSMRKHDWESLTKERFGQLFHDTPVVRRGYETLMRNIRFVSGK